MSLDTLVARFRKNSKKTFERSHEKRIRDFRPSPKAPNNSLLDMTPRYAPRTVLIFGHGEVKVTGYKVHPPGTHHGPIVSSMTALELETPHRSRWYGVERAYINSQLRMVVVGTNRLDEVRMKWKVVPKKFR
jgi:hypothetical protein